MRRVERSPSGPDRPGRGEVGARDRPAALGGGASWGARLERWAADARVDEATRARTRERWLRHQADEDGTLAGVLVDLCELGTRVRIGLRGGHGVAGVVRAVGSDLVALSPDPLSGLAVAGLAAVTAVRGAPGQRAVAGDRRGPSGLRLDDVLSELAADREGVRLLTVDGEAVAGRLRAVGRDVVTVESGPRTGSASGWAGAIYVARAALAAVLVDG